MKVSQAQIKQAREKVTETLNAAYMPVKDNLCWEGRIARAVVKADELINAGQKTAAEMQAIIDGFEAQYNQALAAASAAQDEYYLLCKQAGINPQTFVRPLCPCPTCAERIKYQAWEEYRRAVTVGVEKNFDDDSVIQLRAWGAKCKELGVKVEMKEYIS